MVKFRQDVLRVTNFWTAHVRMRQALAQLWVWSFTRFRSVNGPRNYWEAECREAEEAKTWCYLGTKIEAGFRRLYCW
ncbi:MAG: hypothetical protein JWM16_1398 [Verrucomicrobiales bacterium]|nr:hypothetical protein [Verrucomicrobiales bacterium]